MTAYATYEFYIDSYRCFCSGRTMEITPEDFRHYALLAGAEIDKYTFGNIPPAGYSEQVSYCCCELAEKMYRQNTSEGAGKEGVASESVTGWSQTYEGSEARQSAAQLAYRDIIHKWLCNTGYLYSGV